MEVSAKLKFVRLSPQKARLVADQIRGLPVERAVELLTFSDKKAAGILKKVLESAIANAEHNEGADIDESARADRGRRSGPDTETIQSAGPWSRESHLEAY